MNLRDTINLYRRYPHWVNKHAIFIHVPRAAGTSINRALYGRTLGHYRAVDIRRRFPGLYERSFVFAFVRNPWDRLLSAYRFAVCGNTGDMGIHNPNQYRIPEFESFERFLCEWLPKQNIYESDFVFRPQHCFILGSSGKNIVDFVGKVETLSPDISRVETFLGRSIEIVHTNRTGEVGAYRDAYTSNSMIEIVERFYEKDIHHFGYVF